MKTVKVGIIGCGSIAQLRHLPEYKMNKEVEIVAVCDINEQRAIEISSSMVQKYIKIMKNYSQAKR